MQLYAEGGVAHREAQPLKHLIRKNMRLHSAFHLSHLYECMNRLFVTDTHNNIYNQDTFSSSWTADTDIIPAAV